MQYPELGFVTLTVIFSPFKNPEGLQNSSNIQELSFWPTDFCSVSFSCPTSQPCSFLKPFVQQSCQTFFFFFWWIETMHFLASEMLSWTQADVGPPEEDRRKMYLHLLPPWLPYTALHKIYRHSPVLQWERGHSSLACLSHLQTPPALNLPLQTPWRTFFLLFYLRGD